MRQLIFLITLLALLAACTTYQYIIICKRSDSPAKRRNVINTAVSFASYKLDTSFKTIPIPQNVNAAACQRPLCQF